MTPLDRLLAAGVLSPAQESQLHTYRDSLNPAAIGRQIADLQAVLLRLAKDKTEQLYLAAIPTVLPLGQIWHPHPEQDRQLTPISRAHHSPT